MDRISSRALRHPAEAFTRDALLARKEALLVRNLARMEIFLWDLELFAQVQDRLPGKVLLKGGAAVQLLLPPGQQRTSIDIDMACTASQGEVDSALAEIERDFDGKDGLLKFARHMPEAPKTRLPMATYFADVPSICSREETYREAGRQRVKIEFLFQEELGVSRRLSHPNIFAIKESLEYDILRPSDLLADKLTALGPNTAGIPPERSDEWPKQFYDLHQLLRYCPEVAEDPDGTWDTYSMRVGKESSDRGLAGGPDIALLDGRRLASRLAGVDFEQDSELRKILDDFQSLYLATKTVFSTATWGCIGDELRVLLEGLADGTWVETVRSLYQAEGFCGLPDVSGEERGRLLRALREEMAASFPSAHSFPEKMLKGKAAHRIIWAVATRENAMKVCEFVQKVIARERRA